MTDSAAKLAGGAGSSAKASAAPGGAPAGSKSKRKAGPKESVTRRRSRRRSRGHRGRGVGGRGDGGADASLPVPHAPLDSETADALRLFNAYLEADRERQKRKQLIKKAEKSKNDAAARARRLNDRKASSAKIADAEAAYREAVETLRQLKDGDKNGQ